ncbi:hypothetical protein LOTGIDRAFT_175490 [Lottia gigantea]|uniref:SET domain-containing protein n=1 Tax=Lottia gigantea TaxID=225164 RepID=V4AKL9_LOTGI|nr:hypothetical protein LOTGIDRAFT_175490 [Lottia gigantea]ESO94111.1 hypothetical protein LOTGIDRAFT_175490 [Lottia gigantea]
MTSDPARLRNAVTSNVWLDLFKKGPLPNRGNGVFAMQRHTKGQVVIDNGGHYLSGKEGDAKYYAGSDGGMGYMIKFRFGDKWHYRDASTDDGHMGRLINHSACCPNVKGNPIDIFGDGKPVIVYTATKVIFSGDEILLDYNDSQSSAEFLKKCPVCQGDPLRNNALVAEPDNQPPKKRRKQVI